MFELYLSHGRRDPADNLDDWGFNGPRLAGVIGIHETYRATLRIIFATPAAAEAASRATGWGSWDACELEARIHDDLVTCEHEGQRAYFGDWGLILPENRRAAEASRSRALRDALAFVEGFEDDPSQQGIPGLLALLRACAKSDPAAPAAVPSAMARSPVTADQLADALGDALDEIESWAEASTEGFTETDRERFDAMVSLRARYLSQQA